MFSKLVARHLFALLLLVATPLAAAADLLSPSDQQIYRQAFAKVRAADWAAAQSIAAGAADRRLAEVVRWLAALRDRSARFAEIVAFAEAHPGWPLLAALRERAERKSDEVADAELLPYFRANRPTTVEARLRFAEMLAASGAAEEAAGVARELWTGTELDAANEQHLLGRFAAALRPADDAARLRHLLLAGKYDAAQRQLARVAGEDRLLGEARLALARGLPEAESLLARVPPARRRDPDLLLDEARWLRQQNRLEAAAAVLLDQPEGIARVSAWNAERQTLARRLLDAGSPGLAYRVIAQHGLKPGGADFAEDEFLAGWIALVRLQDPASALPHFTRLYDNVKLPVSIARGAFWAGRAAAALGDQHAGREWFGKAAQHGATFYGQLAAVRLGAAPTLAVGEELRPSAEEKAAFEGEEFVRLVRMLGEVGESSTAKPFLMRLLATAKTDLREEEVARLGAAIGRADIGVIGAKRAHKEELPPLALAYPLLPLADGSPAEPPLVLALTRQESVFDPEAVSRSDARGLMQLKPATAKEVATSLGVPFSADRLTLDPAYNLRLGRAYMAKLLDRFRGSYVLAIAGYNAGPNRVRQWVDAYGDPRDPAVDVVDWIENIPFNETRNYVQRVLENLQIYRLRLGEPAFTLAADLRR